MKKESKSNHIFWSILVVFASVFVLLVLGYFVGKAVYGTVKGSELAGYETWETLYQPVLFYGIDKSARQDYQLNDLFRAQKVKARLVSVDYPYSSVRYKDYIFDAQDGRQYSFFHEDISYKGLEKLATGEEYYLTMEVSLMNSKEIFPGFYSIGKKNKISWYVNEELVHIQKVSEENN